MTTTPASTAPAAPTASAVPTSLDPCQLVTAPEAASLAGASYQTGKEETTKGGGKECVYGSQTKNVFTVILGQASSPAVAQAQWTAVQAETKQVVTKQLPAGVHASLDTTNVANLGDRAATIYGSTSIEGQKIGFSGVYVLSGATFFALTDLVIGATPPGTAKMQSQAQTIIGRLS